MCVCVCACILLCFSHVWLFATLWTEAHKTPSPMGFSRQNTGVGCHTLLQSIFPTQESKLCLLCLLYWQVGSLPLVPAGSVQFSRSVVSDSLWPHESQHTRPRCPSPTPGIYSNPCPSSQWCHRTISSSVIPFSSCPQPLPASGLVQWVNSLHEAAKVLEFQLQHQSFRWTPRTDLL